MEDREWLNEEFFLPVLAKDESEFERILKCSTKAAIPPGQNFTSVLLRSELEVLMKDGSRKRKSYVVKTMLDRDKGGEFFKSMGIFDKEKQMYLHYLPEFEAMYWRAGLNVKLSPKCLLINETDGRIDMVFEDLKADEFRNVDKLKGLDMPHILMTMKKIAEFHAASAVYKELHGPFPEEFKSGFVSRNADEQVRKFYRMKRKAYIQPMADWCETEEEHAFLEKMPSVEQYLRLALRTLDPTDSDFNCLNHGDFWSGNLMFAYDESNKLHKALLLDFQCCNWGSPCQDLYMLVTLSAAREIRFQEFDTFIKTYHDHLVSCLRVLKFQKAVPRLKDLHMALLKDNVAFYPFFAVFNHLPLIMWPEDEKCVFEFLMSDDEEGEKYRKMINANPRYIEQARQIFAFYHKKGIFDFEGI